uniref:Ribosome maturation factor RimP n=1 Tax=Steinernema glaseri TaxID=37863 RepID=A0A1I7Y1D0_9BILA
MDSVESRRPVRRGQRNIADELANFLEESGGISVMISDIPGIVVRRCWEAFNVEVDYGSLSFATSLIGKSDGRLDLSFTNGLAFIELTSQRP